MMRAFAIAVLLLVLIVFSGWLWAKVNAPPNNRFVEGYYSLGPGYFAGESLEFVNGRFRCLPFSDVEPGRAPQTGRYDLAGTRIMLIFDDTTISPEVLEWRNVGGVHVLLSGNAPQIYDKHKKLTSYTNGLYDKAEYYMLKGKPTQSSYLWITGLLRSYPEFANAVSEGYREMHGATWWQYQRMKWYAFPFEHPTLYARLPKFLQSAFVPPRQFGNSSSGMSAAMATIACVLVFVLILARRRLFPKLFSGNSDVDVT